MSAPDIPPHPAGLQVVIYVGLCGWWSHTAGARPSPVVVFPGKATWGYSSDVSEPISFGGGSGRSSRSLDSHTGDFITSRITSGNTEDGQWVGKAFLSNSPSTHVVSTSFTVKGDEKDYRNIDLPGLSRKKQPTLPRYPSFLRPNLPDVRSSSLPMFTPNYFPYDVSRRFPPHFFNFNGGYRVHDPREDFYKTLNGRFPYMNIQSRGLMSDEILSELGRNLSDKNIEELPQKFSSIIIKNILPQRADNNVPVQNSAPNIKSFTLEGNVSEAYNLNDEMNIKEAMVISSDKITSVHERSVDEDNIYHGQVSFGRDQSLNEIIPSNKSTALDTNGTKALPDDQTVLASIYVKPLDSGTLVAYYEDVDSSSYSLLNGSSSRDQLDGLGSTYRESGNSTKKRLPMYIIVKDSGFTDPVSVLGVEQGTHVPVTVDRKAIEDSYRNPPSSNDVSRMDQPKKQNLSDISFPISRRGTSFSSGVISVSESRRLLSSDNLSSTEDKNISSSSDIPSVGNQNNNSFDATSSFGQEKDHPETNKVSSEDSNESQSSDNDCSCYENSPQSSDKLPVDEHRKHSQSSEVSFHESHKHHFPFDEYLPGKEKRPLSSSTMSSHDEQQQSLSSIDVPAVEESSTLSGRPFISENSTLRDRPSIRENSTISSLFSVGESFTTKDMSYEGGNSTLKGKYSPGKTTTAAPHDEDSKNSSSNSIYSVDVYQKPPTLKDIALTNELFVAITVKSNEYSPERQAIYPKDKNFYQPAIKMLEADVSAGHPLTSRLGVVTLILGLLVAAFILM